MMSLEEETNMQIKFKTSTFLVQTHLSQNTIKVSVQVKTQTSFETKSISKCFNLVPTYACLNTVRNEANECKSFLFWSSQDSSTFSDLQFFINLVTHHCCDMIVTNLPSVPIPYLRDTKKKHDEKQNYVKAFKLLLMEKRIFNSSGSTLLISSSFAAVD